MSRDPVVWLVRLLWASVLVGSMIVAYRAWTLSCPPGTVAYRGVCVQYVEPVRSR